MYKIFRFNFAIEYLEKNGFYEKIIKKFLRFWKDNNLIDWFSRAFVEISQIIDFF